MVCLYSDAVERGAQRWSLLNTALFTDGLYLRITARDGAADHPARRDVGDGAHDIAYPRVVIERRGRARPSSNTTSPKGSNPGHQLQYAYRLEAQRAAGTLPGIRDGHNQRISIP